MPVTHPPFDFLPAADAYGKSDERLVMTVSLRDALPSAEARAWIEKAFPDYLDALTEVSSNTGIFPVHGEFGERQPDLLARWFNDSSSCPLLLLKEGQPVGFAVVGTPSPLQRGKIDYRMAEFFVSPKQRRLGVGRDAVRLIFKRFAGRWEITELQSNRSAVAFWRAVVSQFSQGQYRERIENAEVKQYFDSRQMTTI